MRVQRRRKEKLKQSILHSLALTLSLACAACARRPGWAEITGYKFAEVANQTSSFLQGPDTARQDERHLVGELANGQHAKVRLLNYRKDGMPFWNTLECFPLRDPAGQLTHYCGVIRAEPAPLERFAPRASLQGGAAVPKLEHAAPTVAAARGSGGRSKRSKKAGSVGTQCGSGNSSDDAQSIAGSSESGISRRTTQENTGPAMPPLPLPMPDASMTYKGQPPPSPTGRHRPKRNRAKGLSLGDALTNSKEAVVLTQPYPPYLITHVNQPWCEMCGYTQEEVEGLPNAILQGPETDQGILDDLMSSVARGEATSATLVNYKKGGNKFVNQVRQGSTRPPPGRAWRQRVAATRTRGGQRLVPLASLVFPLSLSSLAHSPPPP